MSSDQPARRSSNGRILLYALAAVVVFFAFKGFLSRNQRFIGKVPQEFPADGSWLGTNAPLRLADLRGKVVLLQFSFINCPYCREMDPYLHKWHDEFGSDGFVVVEIDDGDSDSVDELRNWMASAGVTYPVYYDAKGKMITAYGINSFPTLLLIGRDGKVVWEGFGWGGKAGVDKLEKEIRSALKR